MQIPIHEKTVSILRQGPGGYLKCIGFTTAVYEDFRPYARSFDLPPLQLGDG